MNTRSRHPSATCRFCRRSRPLRVLWHRDDDSYECRDEVSCSEATQLAPGGDDGR